MLRCPTGGDTYLCTHLSGRMNCSIQNYSKYHGCFELVLESLGNNPIAADFEYYREGSPFYYEDGILCVLIRIAFMRRF